MTQKIELPYDVEWAEAYEATSGARQTRPEGDYNCIGLGRTTDFPATLAKFCKTHCLLHLDIYRNQKGSFVAEIYGYRKYGARDND